MPAPEDLPFPHVSQALLIERYVTDLAGNPLSAVAALGVASPGPDKAGPADLARYVRGQWAIKSHHWLRDTLCQGQITGQNALRARNHGRHAQPGHQRPAPGRAHRHHRSHRWASRSMDRPFTILGLT